MTKVINARKSIYPAWRARYSTPFGKRWMTVHAKDAAFARQLASLKTPYRAGWVLELVEAANAR